MARPARFRLELFCFIGFSWHHGNQLPLAEIPCPGRVILGLIKVAPFNILYNHGDAWKPGKGDMTGKFRGPMLYPTLFMGALALILLYIGYRQGGGQHVMGMKSALILMVQILPLLFCAFVVAGMVQSLIPREAIAKWIGNESGMRGILIGTVAGGLSPGGPFVSLPLAAGLMRTGAGVGTMVAYLTGWSLWAVARLPMEVGILGWKFTMARFASTFVLPPVAGLIAHVFFSGLR